METIKLDELRTRGESLTTPEAAAIVHEVCRHAYTGGKAGQLLLPASLDELALTRGGNLLVESRSSDCAGLGALASLIEELLAHVPEPPVGFRLLVPRARGISTGLAPLHGVHDVAEAVRRFEEAEPPEVLRRLATRVSDGAAETHAESVTPVNVVHEASVIAPLTGAVKAGIPPAAIVKPTASMKPQDPESLDLDLDVELRSSDVDALRAPVLLSDGDDYTSERRVYVEPTLFSSAKGPQRWRPAVRAAVVAALLLNGVLASITVPHYLGKRRQAPAAVEVESAHARVPAPTPEPTLLTEPTPVAQSMQPAQPAPAVQSPARATSTGPAPTARTPTRVATPGIRGPVFSPSFDMSGKSLLFHAGRERPARLVEASLGQSGVVEHLEEIAVVDAGNARSFHPRLSPDGRFVAFDSDRDGERGVYVANRDGTGVKRVSGDGYAAVPSWSHDGAWLAFARAEPGRPNVWNIWLRDNATGQLKRLTTHAYGQTWGASWFSDSQRICYSHEDRLIVMDVSTGRARQYPSPRAGRLVRTPAVSPDGSRIVFQVYRDGVWLLDVGEGWMRRIISDPTAEEFAWDPVGRRVAYHSRRDGEWRIWIAAPPA